MFHRGHFVLSCVLIFASFTLGKVTKDNGIVRFYKELGCTQNPGGSKDPLSYDCPSFTQSTETTCVVHGKTYKLDEAIEAEPGACLAACRCVNSHRAKRAKPLCANIECPEFFGVPVKRHCQRTYSVDRCCATGLVCDSAAQKDTSNATSERIISKSTPPVTCNVNGVVYEEHSKYYPDEFKCSRCVCMKGHDGTHKAPWCTDIPCSLELRFSKYIQDGCAPVYIRTNESAVDGQCCPYQFRCPSAEDKILAPSTDVTKDIKKNTDQKFDAAKEIIQASKDHKLTATPTLSKDTKKEEHKLTVTPAISKDMKRDKEQKGDVKSIPETKQRHQCTFGNLKLNVGERIEPSANEPRVKCICEIPPVMTCYSDTL